LPPLRCGFVLPVSFSEPKEIQSDGAGQAAFAIRTSQICLSS
jgi:hypothetical protein